MENINSKAQELWEKFLVLTQEMFKFIEKNEIDTFLELLNQRLKLQEMIENLPKNEYHLSNEGKRVIAQINPINVEIQYKVQLWLNKTKKSQSMARAYDSLGYELAGFSLNRKF